VLITNFAAGELSETLFGRIDLPQYYQGASRIENFDVIPTGGVSRRRGMKRLAELPAEGRIIPFILDRESGFLLFLSPGMMRMYRDGQPVGSPVTSSAQTPLYQTLEEIHEVQYAQNYDMMILTHENYAPLRVRLVDGSLQTDLFPVLNKVAVHITGELEAVTEYDETYSGYLKSPGNYPCAVTFFNGRVVFAGTKNNRQRIFASKSNDYYNFSTYDLFLTEQREYVVVLGSIEPEAPDKIIIDKEIDAIRFTRRPEEYHTDSGFFDDAVITDMSGAVITLSENAKIEIFNYQVIEAELEAKKAQFESWENDPVTRTAAYYKAVTNDGELPFYGVEEHTFYIKTYAHQTQIVLNKKFGGDGEGTPDTEAVLATLTFPENACALYGQASAYFQSEIDAFCTAFFASDSDWNKTWENWTVVERTRYTENQAFQANDAETRIMATMRYGLDTAKGTEWYYGYPETLLSKVLNRITSSTDIYIPFYTVNIIEDRYPTADDGFTFEIASDMSDAIRWIGQNKHILVGTETAEWVIPSGVNATNVQAVLNSRYGSDRIQGTSVGDAFCFFQAGGRALVEYYIPQQDNNFRANNMAMLSPAMLHESPAFDFDFVSSPYTKIFVSRQDGALATLLYERGSGTFAWSRVTTEGSVRSVATMPGESGGDEVYLVLKRGARFFLELLTEEGPEVFLDSYRDWDGSGADYDGGAVVYDETDDAVFGTDKAPVPGHTMRVGYPYASLIRSMPVIANERMKQNNIKNLLIRFLDSFMPRVRSLPNGEETFISRDGPFSGVVKVNFPGGWEYDVFFELSHSAPTRCRILSVNAETN
jgi:hypothetical protein